MSIRKFLKKRANLITAIVDWVTPHIDAYKSRLSSNFALFHNETSLKTELNSLSEQSFLNNVAYYSPKGGYSAGKIYNVRNTDGVSPNDLTVTGGGGTVINKDGILENVEYNRFGDPYYYPWVSRPFHTVEVITAPDGTNTARRTELLSESQLAWRILNYDVGTGIHTFTHYTRKVVSTSNAQFRMVLGGNKGIGFDLNTGTINLTAGGAVGSIEDKGNGWYKCTMKITTTGNQSFVAEFINQNIGDTYDWWNRTHTTGGADVPKIDYRTGQVAFLVEPASTNRLLNSGTLSTQSYTTTATPYTLSFYGTGSITLSGSHSATLTGTGVNQRVTLTFTPTAASLTLTVSGTVTNAQLEEGSEATSYIPTDAEAVTRPETVVSIPTPTGVNSIVETIDGVEQAPITTIPATYQMPQGNINKVIFTKDGSDSSSSNTAPTTGADNYSVDENNTLTVNAANGVLSNDTDADGDILTTDLVSTTSNGSLTLNSDGSFTYTPNANYFGSDSFVYRAYDGQAYSANRTVNITINDVTEPVEPPTGSYEAETTTFMNAIAVPNNSTVYFSGTPQQLTGNQWWSHINNFVKDLKIALNVDDLSTKLLAVYPRFGGTLNRVRYNLLNSEDSNAAFRSDYFGTWNHDETGSKPASNGYIQNYINPLVHLPLSQGYLLAVRDVNVGFGFGTLAGGRIAMSWTTTAIGLQLGTGGSNAQSTTVDLSNGGILGFNRVSGATTANLWLNKAVVGTHTNVSSNIPNNNEFFESGTSSGGGGLYSNNQSRYLASVYFNTNLTNAEVVAVSQAIETFETNVNRKTW